MENTKETYILLVFCLIIFGDSTVNQNKMKKVIIFK